MLTLSGLVATLIVGGASFGLILVLPLFLLALLGVMGIGDRTVRQHPSVSRTDWRDGS